MIDLRANPHKELLTRYIQMLGHCGFALDGTSKILDFGCGSGAIVYAFRDSGYDARGFDIHDTLELREEADRQQFRILSHEGKNKSDFVVNWASFRMPYPDGAFDFVFSTEVLEHVQNHDAVLRELSRVMKSTSIGIHTFPSKWRLIEPHINIPFGGIVKWYPYFLFWTLLGVRNSYYRDRPAVETAKAFHSYALTGLNYLSLSELLALGRRHFSSQRIAPELWAMPYLELAAPLPRRLRRWLYSRMRHVVWVLTKDGACE